MINFGQFSFLLALAMGAVFLVGVTWNNGRWRWAGLAAALLLVGGWWLVLRPGAGGTATASTLSAALAEGKPVVVEVYSDY